jgi:CBS domain containing-hemolysin-like protein
MLYSLVVIVALLMILIAGMRPIRSGLSQFERNRRANNGDQMAKDLIRRERLLNKVLSLQRLVIALLLVATSGLSIGAFGWFFGLIVVVIITIWYGALSRTTVIKSLSRRIYSKYESVILRFVERFPTIFKLIGSDSSSDDISSRTLDSREELEHLVSQSTGVLSREEKLIIEGGLSFGSKSVESVMIPRSAIDTINKSEFLGPLTLDDLHKTGHSRIPVIDGDIDHVIGILHLRGLLALDIKRSVTAEKAMEAKVYYIRQNQNLQHALTAFIRTHHHMFIVVNEFRETVGMLTLEDVVEELLGHQIIDEFDSHDDLRKVAIRNPHHNNQPDKTQNV